MKKIFVITLLAVFYVISSSAQQSSQMYLWPIQGAKAGTDIISAPQSYINGELNFYHLFIAAPEGTTVLSPIDGVIKDIGVMYRESLAGQISYRMGEDSKNFDEKLQKVRAEFIQEKDWRNPKYLQGDLGIKTTNGKMLYISGLSGREIFKTGQTIKRGDVLGKVAYSYHKIPQPSICISISKNDRCDDPMSPFGIMSSFIAPGEFKPAESFTKEMARKELTVYFDALKEAYPGLYDGLSAGELEDYIQKVYAQINSTSHKLTIDDIWRFMTDATVKIHDSHIGIQYPAGVGKAKQVSSKSAASTVHTQPAIIFGWIRDTLVCTNAALPYAHLVGKQIQSINGLTADAIKKSLLSEVSGYDARVESMKEYHLAYQVLKPERQDMNLVFTNGDSLYLPAVGDKEQFVYNRHSFYNINRHQGGYSVRIIDSSTAYLGLSTFNLSQVDMEKIANFINSMTDTKTNLIIDVRNNSGGSAEVVDQMYSYIAGKPFIVNSYNKVNKNTPYECFLKSMNLSGVDAPYKEYVPVEGKNGFYLNYGTGKTIRPDSATNFKGRVYMLTNEFSSSAATLLPAMLVREQRGMVIGRETRSAHHFVNALDFVKIRLPNSGIEATIPLIKCVFDDVVNDRMPYGRGVLPDYFTPITIEEMSFENGDAILNYTLDLIRKDNCITGENQSAASDVPIELWVLGCFILTVVSLSVVFFVRRYPR